MGDSNSKQKEQLVQQSESEPAQTQAQPAPAVP